MELKAFKARLKAVDGEGKYEAYASVFGNVDENGDIVEPGAFTKTLKEREVFPIVWFHYAAEVLGGARLEQDKRGLKVYGELNLDVASAREKWALMKQGVVTDHSFAYDVINADTVAKEGRTVRMLKELKLYEVSPLPAGFAANPKATVTLVKSSGGRLELPDAIDDDIEAKGATGYQNLPLAERAHKWDAGAARKRLLAWAKSGEDIDWAKYRKGFLWYDAAKPDAAGSYKLPIADVIDGSLKAVPKAIFAAGAVLAGARGGVNIPSGDVAKVKAHLAKYYKRLDAKPPWEKGGVIQVYVKDDLDGSFIPVPGEVHTGDTEPVVDHSGEDGKSAFAKLALAMTMRTLEMKLLANRR